MIGKLLDILFNGYRNSYILYKSVTPFYPEPYSQSTLFKEFGSVAFQCLPQIGIQKINPKVDVFCARYFCFYKN